MVSSKRDESPRLAGLLKTLSGGLIEIYVFHADRDIWKQVLGVLSRKTDSLDITVDGRHVDISQFDEVRFDVETMRVMRALVDDAEWTSTLFREDQVDLQMDPDDFSEAAAVEKLLSVLQEIADATRRVAVLVPEAVRPEDTRPLALAHPS